MTDSAPRASTAEDLLPEEVIRPATASQMRLLIAGFVVAVVAINFGAGVLIDRDSRNLGYWLVREKWNKLLALDHPVDWLVLGDSSGNQAVMPSALTARFGGRGLNLCTVGNLIAVNDVWMLERYIQRFGPPRHVVIVHVYDMWKRPLERALVAKIPLPWGFWNRLDPPVTFARREQVSMFTDRYVPLYSQNLTLTEMIRHPHALPIGPIHMQDDGFMATSLARPDAVARDYEQHLSDNEQEAPRMTDQNREALQRISALADQDGFDVYLANAPLYDRLYQHEGFAQYYERVVNIVAEAVHSSPRVHLVLRTPQTIPLDQLQGVDHVTETGAAVYSRALVEAIAAADRRTSGGSAQ